MILVASGMMPLDMLSADMSAYDPANGNDPNTDLPEDTNAGGAQG